MKKKWDEKTKKNIVGKGRRERKRKDRWKIGEGRNKEILEG